MADLGMSFDPSAVPPRGVFANAVEAALEYHARGYAPVPIPPREKGPKLSNWQTLKATPERIRQLFRSNSNIGCNLGAISGGLVDIDLDCREAREFSDAILPATESVFGRASNPASHRLYTVAGPLPTKRFADPVSGGTIVEIRGDGGSQTVFPPSVHPSGEIIEWADDGDPEIVDGDELAAAVACLAVRVLVSRYGDRPHEETCEGWLAALNGAPDRAREKAREWLGVGAAGEPQEAPSARQALTQRTEAQSAPAVAGRAGASHDVGARERAYAERALADECAKVAATGEGGRNNALNNAALKVGHFVGAGWIDRATCEAALREAAAACGHTKDKGPNQTKATIKSGLDKGASEPHAPLQDREPEHFHNPQPKAKAEACATIVIDGETFDAETGERIEAEGELAAKSAPAQPQPQNRAKQRLAIEPRLFVWRDPSTIPMREWLYGKHLARKFVSVTLAAGGVGKSTLLLGESIAMAARRNLLGHTPAEPLRVWFWNGEDPIEEIERRVAAIMLHYEIAPEEIGDRLFLNSGRETEIVIATTGRDGVKIATPVFDAMVAAIERHRIDVLIIDPFVSSHRVAENDNVAIDAVAKAWARIADRTGCAVELVHHARKIGGSGEVTVEDGRGAVSLIGAARSVRMLNVMTDDEAERAGIGKRRSFFRVDNGKSNMAPPPERSEWFQIVSQSLGNGGLLDGDHVGVATTWEWPNPLDGLSVADLRKVQDAMAEGEFAESAQATNWAGHAVGSALGLDLASAGDKARVKALLRTWIKSGALKVETRRNSAKGRDQKLVVVGDRA